jgi:hypothetical protein
MAIHSATASFKETTDYFNILGGCFTGHGPVAPFKVQPARTMNEAFEGIPAFTVTDELYLHELQQDIRVQFTAKLEGEQVPVVWTHPYGLGRVCYACPGHRTATMRHPGYQEVIRRGIEWVCGQARK